MGHRGARFALTRPPRFRLPRLRKKVFALTMKRKHDHIKTEADVLEEAAKILRKQVEVSAC